MATIIDGISLSASILQDLKVKVETLKKNNIIPSLCLIRIGDDLASGIYVNGKIIDCQKVGIRSELIHLSEFTSQTELLTIIKTKNEDPLIHAILVQLPIPSHINEQTIITNIDSSKDVDGFHPVNAGFLAKGILDQATIACTPAGIIKMLDSTGICLEGKNAVVVGRSNIVGKPIALLLLAKNCTVTICHSKTKNLPEIIAQADILITALGKSEFIKGNWIKTGAIVIDVGMNRNKIGKLTGDIEYMTAKDKASFISPVPGGVGPMTRAMLIANTIKLAERSKSNS